VSPEWWLIQPVLRTNSQIEVAGENVCLARSICNRSEGSMSLTQTFHVFAGVSENGINTFVKALFTRRPRYLNYGSPSFVATSTVNATSMSAISFPGIPGGIQYAVSFIIPTLDLFPPDAGSGSPIPPGPNQFGLHTKVKLTVGCFTWTSKPGNDERGRVVPLSVVLDVWALGTLVSHYYGPGTGYVGLQVVAIRIPAIQPQPLEGVIDCLIRMMLNAVVENVNLPFHVLSAGAFQLALESGPTIENDQVTVWGDI
jgi:hypothetical protein